MGAVRHSGFIPWDDDLDIAIPIEDFLKFVKLASTNLPDYLQLFTPKTAKHDTLLHIKVMDIRTTMIESCFSKWPDTYEGVWVDIMPLSGIPSAGFKQEIFKIKRNIFGYLSIYSKISFPSERRLIGKLFWCFIRPIAPLFPQDFLFNKWIKWLSRYPCYNSEYTGYVWSWKLSNLIFPISWFSDYVYMDFEDTKIRCPIGWHEFLTQMFGDYKLYPSAENRNSGHDFTNGMIDLNHSYIDYQTGAIKFEHFIKNK